MGRILRSDDVSRARGQGAIAVVRFLDVFAQIDVSARAPHVRCPTLVLHNRDDLRVPRTQAQELAALIPNSELRFLASRNHILTADEPAWPHFLTEIEQFLAAD